MSAVSGDDVASARENDYRALVEGVPGIVYAWSARRGGLYYSGRSMEILGYTPEALYAQPMLWHDSIHPDDVGRVDAAVAEARAGGTFCVEYRIRDARGRERWIEDRLTHCRREGDDTVLEGFAREITDRKRAEQSLQESEQRFRAVFESAPDAMFLADPETGLVLDANKAACCLLQRPHEAVVGLHQSKLHPPVRTDFSTHSFRHHVEEAQESGTTHPVENYVLRADGSEVPVEVMAQVVQLQGKPAVLGTFRDITERKRVEAAMRAGEAALRQSLHEKEALLKEVHHRVKNNLQVVQSLLRLEETRSDAESVRRVLADLQGRVRSMAVLHELLYRSSAFSGVELGDYLRKISAQCVRAVAARGKPARLQLQLTSVQVGLEQAMPAGLLVNELLSNCFKHAFPEGREGEVRVELRRLGDGPQLHLTVSDNGVGLPERFELTQSKTLGLQLASDLAAQLGGRLEIGPGPGASFGVTFALAPLSEGPPST